eukprot:5214167-Pyramimonas_sp.AAC.2
MVPREGAHRAVEAARAHERLVETLVEVGSGDDDDALVGFEAVQLNQNLVQRHAHVLPSPNPSRVSQPTNNRPRVARRMITTLLRFTGPPVSVTARVHSTPHGAPNLPVGCIQCLRGLEG